MKVTYPLVIVEWDDHYEMEGWSEKHESPTQPEKCVTVGWLVDDREDAVVIVSCLDGNDPAGGSRGGAWYILKPVITKTTILRKGRKT